MKANRVYIPTTDRDDINLTGNLTELLGETARGNLRGITPEELTRVFGEREVWCYEYERGYTDPDWNFKTGDKPEIVGIGFRWGVPRLRGKGLTIETANDFIQYVTDTIAAENKRLAPLSSTIEEFSKQQGNSK